VSFPTTEGIGIFVGIVAWDVLGSGEAALLKAALVAGAGTLVLYGYRCRRAKRLGHPKADDRHD
jgi:hypothetical protein